MKPGNNKFCVVVAAVTVSFCLLSCSSTNVGPADLESNWLQSGSIVIAKPLPEVSSVAQPTMLGFLPSPAVRSGTWLAISTRDETLSLMNGSEVVAKVRGEGVSKMVQGNYQLLHKQRGPLWYAPDSYFSRRGLEIPANGSQSRFLRGALGDFALFLTKDTPIHSGPLWTDDIGGVHLEENDISRIYYQLELDSHIEVR